MHTVPADVLQRHDHKVPNYIAASVQHIDFGELKQAGARHLVLDVDNTLVSFGDSRLRSHVWELFAELRVRGAFETISLATNSRRDLSLICETIRPDHLFQPHGLVMKPFPDYYEEVLRRIGTNGDGAVMIGDKLVQDVWGSRKVGMKAVLVKPLGRDFLVDQMFGIRWRERRLLRKYLPHHNEHWF